MGAKDYGILEKWPVPPICVVISEWKTTQYDQAKAACLHNSLVTRGEVLQAGKGRFLSLWYNIDGERFWEEDAIFKIPYLFVSLRELC